MEDALTCIAALTVLNVLDVRRVTTIVTNAVPNRIPDSDGIWCGVNVEVGFYQAREGYQQWN